MDDLKLLLGNAAILFAIFGIFAFVFRKWIVASIQTHFAKELQKAKAEIELESRRYSSFAEKRDTIYPEILELVYRLRNGYRDFVEAIPNEGIAILERRGSFPSPPQESSDALYMLAENLYKYRAVIDEDTFNLLHAFKRRLQDGKVLLDRVTRTPPKPTVGSIKEWQKESESSIIRHYEESKEELHEILLVE